MKNKIKVIGMGSDGVGIGTIDYMIDSCISGADYMILDTTSTDILDDMWVKKAVKEHKKSKGKALENSKAIKKIVFNVSSYLDVTRPNEFIKTFSLETVGKYSTGELEQIFTPIYGEGEFIRQVSNTAIIQNEFKDTDRVILVVGLGDYSCTEILHLVVAILNKLNVSTTVFAVKGEFQSSQGKVKVDECIEKTKKYADEVIVIDTENINNYSQKTYKNSLNYSNKANEVICEMIKEKIAI